MKSRSSPYTTYEVVKMDYSGFSEFPFPSRLSSEGEKIRDYFLDLPDSEQLELLNRSRSYETFYRNVVTRMGGAETAVAK